jgi:hypothetical protein
MLVLLEIAPQRGLNDLEAVGLGPIADAVHPEPVIKGRENDLPMLEHQAEDPAELVPSSTFMMSMGFSLEEVEHEEEDDKRDDAHEVEELILGHDGILLIGMLNGCGWGWRRRCSGRSRQPRNASS